MTIRPVLHLCYIGSSNLTKSLLISTIPACQKKKKKKKKKKKRPRKSKVITSTETQTGKTKEMPIMQKVLGGDKKMSSHIRHIKRLDFYTHDWNKITVTLVTHSFFFLSFYLSFFSFFFFFFFFLSLGYRGIHKIAKSCYIPTSHNLKHWEYLKCDIWHTY